MADSEELERIRYRMMFDNDHRKLEHLENDLGEIRAKFAVQNEMVHELNYKLDELNRRLFGPDLSGKVAGSFADLTVMFGSKATRQLLGWLGGIIAVIVAGVVLTLILRGAGVSH